MLRLTPQCSSCQLLLLLTRSEGHVGLDYCRCVEGIQTKAGSCWPLSKNNNQMTLERTVECQQGRGCRLPGVLMLPL